MIKKINLGLILIMIINFETILVCNNQKNLDEKLSKLSEVKQFYIPFQVKNRRDYQTFRKRILSVFGDHRDSYKKGHKHSGTDLVGRLREPVYAIGKGIVVDKHLGFPHRTIVVAHKYNGKLIYSTYKHIVREQVSVGDSVDENTVVAYLFNAEEKIKSKFQVNHLHFEIKIDISDEGRASFLSMTMKELLKYHLDPDEFMKKVLK